MDSSVTVVVPAFNAADCLARALDSLRDQTLAPQQVIVVDDGSTDDTAKIAEQHGVLCLRQERGGPGRARNLGVEAATTEFVAFLDADDWYDPEKLARSVTHLQQLGAQCVATDAWIVRDGRITGRKNGGRPVPPTLTQEQLLRGNPVVCSSVVARRAAVLAVKGFDPNPDLIATEDYDLWLRMAQNEPISYLSEPLSFYRVADGSLSNNGRFLRGVDLALSKVEAKHQGEAHFLNLVQRRRADVRLDVAWDHLRSGEFALAREWLEQAAEFARGGKFWRMWLRCRLRLRPRS